MHDLLKKFVITLSAKLHFQVFMMYVLLRVYDLGAKVKV